ncbi:alpha/beta hydrolase [Demequina mangrovi]|uniref:Serine aminopeptidase S33 domain-containing protein n=1 Tax=Demequina mangrovi TaxID=1043493 RepID=A0A1H7B2V0_9MICO|nr:alpha/beta fold hydrolase [Demequina mangrovi]SEJ71778.1 hypothetical protein SAMN05421637_2791 [Demequina mangrovi]
MTVTETTIDVAGATLAATFTSPSGPGPFPAALILAGSGPLDRDGDAKRVPLHVSRDLAGMCEAQGWATLRFDKRGVGGSTGEYLPTGFWDELADARAALAWLQARPETGPVIVIGHSLGASFAAELAAENDDVAGAILLAATAKTGEETLLWQAPQVARGLPRFAQVVLRLTRTDVVKQQRKALDRLRASTGDVERIQGARVNARWMREFLAYDPRPALDRLSVPVLALTGEKDVQVDPADLEAIRAAAPTAETHLVPDVDHILRHEPAAVSNVQRYRKQALQPIAAEVEGRVDAWLARMPATR